jgi:hypothetical protein
MMCSSQVEEKILQTQSAITLENKSAAALEQEYACESAWHGVRMDMWDPAYSRPRCRW